MTGIEFGGVHTSELGLVLKTLQRSAGAEIRRKEVEIPGKDGVYSFPYKKRGNKTHIARLSYVVDDIYDARQKERKIGAWLSPQDAILKFDDEPEIEYIATAYSEIVPSEDTTIREVAIEFECQPFGLSREKIFERYVSGNLQETVLYYGTEAVGLGSQQGAMFEIEIDGNFDSITLEMNTAQMAVNRPFEQSLIIIDNVNGSIVENGESVIKDVTFNKFLSLLPGGNLLEISGTGLQCFVRLKYKELYV